IDAAERAGAEPPDRGERADDEAEQRELAPVSAEREPRGRGEDERQAGGAGEVGESGGPGRDGEAPPVIGAEPLEGPQRSHGERPERHVGEDPVALVEHAGADGDDERNPGRGAGPPPTAEPEEGEADGREREADDEELEPDPRA